MKKIAFFLIMPAMLVSLVSCGKTVPAKVVAPGEIFSNKTYGVCIDIKDLKDLNRKCNIQVR